MANLNYSEGQEAYEFDQINAFVQRYLSQSIHSLGILRDKNVISYDLIKNCIANGGTDNLECEVTIFVKPKTKLFSTLNYAFERFETPSLVREVHGHQLPWGTLATIRFDTAATCTDKTVSAKAVLRKTTKFKLNCFQNETHKANYKISFEKNVENSMAKTAEHEDLLKRKYIRYFFTNGIRISYIREEGKEDKINVEYEGCNIDFEYVKKTLDNFDPDNSEIILDKKY